MLHCLDLCFPKKLKVYTSQIVCVSVVKPASGTFHASVRSSSGNQEETYALVIDQLRLLRNEYCHLSKAELSKVHFDTYVQLVINALKEVNFDTTSVDAIGQMTENDFPTEKVQKLCDCHVKELQAMNMFHESVEQKLSDIHEMMKNTSLGDKGEPGTLPKPHIPRSDPMFTGREDEIKQITDLITDQSTRLLNIWGSPGFENVVARVVRISFYVPLAMKILASSLVENSEDIANKMLDEFNFSENLLEQIDMHGYEEKMQKIFESVFERLTLHEKQALICLTACSSDAISEDAAIDVVSGEMGSTSKSVKSLGTLVKKAFIDKSLISKYYSIHPLIHSFLMDKGKQSDFETVLNSSRLRFCRYYLLLFERLNDDFLAGKLVDSPQLQDTMYHLSTAMFQSIANGSENCNDVFRILSKSEIFFFLINVPHSASQNIHKLYDLAIEKSKTLTNDFIYLKLHVSKYFQRIAFSLFVQDINVGIPKSVRENIVKLSDGTAAKLFCYEAIHDICNGMVVRNGIQQIEKYLDSLQDCANHLLFKCMCLQILVAYYSSLNQLDKSCKFREMAFDVCSKIGNLNLFLIDDCDHKTEDVNESLILFSYLFSMWSKTFSSAEIKRHVFNYVYKLQQQKEVEECSSYYVYQIICYCYYVVASLGVSFGQKPIMDENIESLHKLLIGFQDSSDVRDKAFCDISQKTMGMEYSIGHLLFSYHLKVEFTDDKDLSIEACRNALDLSLQHFGERHKHTAQCYSNIGVAENNAENYISSLHAFDQALEIMLTVNREPDDFKFLADLYLNKGGTHGRLGESKQAIECYEEALNIKAKNYDEESEEIAEILFLTGWLQYKRMKWTSALATLERALRTRIKLFSEKRCSYKNLVVNYHTVGCVYDCLGNDSESKLCFESALEILKTCADDRESKEYVFWIYLALLDLKLDENFYMEVLDASLPVINEYNKSLSPILYLRVCLNQLQLGKKEAGLAFLQKALDSHSDAIQREHADIREHTVWCYSAVVSKLIDTGEYKLAKNTLDRGLQIAESIPGGRKPSVIFRCYLLKGRIHIEEQEYALAIQSLQHAHLQFSEVSFETGDVFKEFHCRKLIALAHYHQGNYKDALCDVLSIIKDRLLEGSKDHADMYILVANIALKMKNKKLVVRNLHLAYEAYSKVLGKNHPKTRQTYMYIAYVEEYAQGYTCLS
ncbi:Nephrocystin-3 [Paramuricea clavata]|uniref:Nephrocystin-3, partial n=1 Tax=Paramuricea clavata TaxID=317549 RepID=A0A6S7HZN5_PARCT|nr:Nephrocystin-3 [Paramuricea clavata]